MRQYLNTIKSHFLIFLFFASHLFAQDAILELWNGKTPNLKRGAENIQEVAIYYPEWGTIITKVSKPIIEVYLPSKEIATGTAVVICPGGGYVQLGWDVEGREVAQWLKRIGVAGIVLKYRLPDPMIVEILHIAPIQDAHRAIRLARYHAAEWDLDVNKVGIMGFSAGGHLAGSATVHADSTFAMVDTVDSLSAAPDFLILGYPVVTMGPGTHSGSKNSLLGSSPDPALVDYFSVEKQVTQNTPHTFIVVASNDGTVSYEPNSLALFNALQKVNVPAEMWVYPESLPSNHGFGMGQNSKEAIEWSWRLAQWMRANGWSQIVPDKPRYTFLRTSSKAMYVRAEATEKMVHIECDTTWTILQKTAAWITVDKQNGAKVDSLLISVNANASGFSRQAFLVFGNSFRVDTIRIAQAAHGHFGLLVTGGSELNQSESEILSAALAAGIVLNPKDDDSIPVTGPESEKVDLILITDSVNKTRVGNAYRDVALPVMVMETGLFDGMRMTAPRAYGVERNVGRLNIIDGAHPLAGGLAFGPQTVFSQPASMNWGKPGAHAVKIATLENDTTKATIFAYEKGNPLVDGFIAPDKRIGFFTTSNSNPILSANGRQLLTAALIWLLEKGTKVAPNIDHKPLQQFELQPNFPNPFNPTTTISFNLPQSATVQLLIFNQSGRLVRTFSRGSLSTGPHRIQWDAADETGVPVASGVYIYKLLAGPFSTQRKMLLLR